MGKKRVAQEKTEQGGAKIEVPGEKASANFESSSKKKIQEGIVHIQATYNNTIIAISDLKGNILAWSSAGALGFRGSKKATPYAAARVAEIVVEKVKKSGLQDVAIYVKGVGSGRESAIRSIINHGLQATIIKDITPLPHNGPRPPKPRRV